MHYKISAALSLFCLSGMLRLFAQSDSISMSVNIDDVIVTAQYAPSDSRSAMHRVRTISRESIERRGVITLEQLLQQELNIRISQDLILGSSMSLQGVSGQNVKIMIDGVPVIGRTGDDIDLGQINLFNIERVEVIEGPVSAFYGTNALGGVINLITKKSQLGRWEAGLTLQAEEPGALQADARVGWRPFAKALIQLKAGTYKFDGFNTQAFPDSTYNRTFQWNPKTQQYAEGALRYDWGNEAHVRYAFAVFDEVIDNYGQLRRPQFKPYAFDDRYATRRYNHTLYHEGNKNERWYWTLTAAYNSFRRQKNTWRLDMESGERMETPGEQDTTTYKALVLRPTLALRTAASKLSFQAGLDVNVEAGKGPRLASSENADFSAIGDYAVFGSLRYEWTKALSLQADARAAYNTRVSVPVVPSFHVRYAFSQALAARASYARGFRSPSLKELLFYFVDANHYIIGNPDLQSEDSDNVQASATWDKTYNAQRYQVTAGAFYNDIRNRIDLYDYVEMADGTRVPAASLDTVTMQYSYFNQALFRSLGGNLRLQMQTARWECRVGYALTGLYNPLSESTVGLPEYTFINEVNGELSHLFPKIGLRLSAYTRYNDRLVRYFLTTDDAGNKVTAQSTQQGFVITDVSASQSLWGKRIQISLGTRNLFNVRNVPLNGNGSMHSGGEGTSPVAIGRVYFARLAWSFSK